MRVAVDTPGPTSAGWPECQEDPVSAFLPCAPTVWWPLSSRTKMKVMQEARGLAGQVEPGSNPGPGSHGPTDPGTQLPGSEPVSSPAKWSNTPLQKKKKRLSASLAPCSAPGVDP